jgi:hypothetical protein
MLTAQQIEAQLNESGAIANVGQIAADEVRLLNEAAKAGRLIKYRGHWDSLHPSFGIGPLKACWALPSMADAIAPFAIKRA